MRYAVTVLLCVISIVNLYAQVGINTTTPKTILDVNGALTTREVSFSLSGNTVNIDTETSLANITGVATAVVSVTCYIPGINGHQLIIYNNTSGNQEADFYGNIIPNNQARAFIYTNSIWKSYGGGATAVTTSNAIGSLSVAELVRTGTTQASTSGDNLVFNTERVNVGGGINPNLITGEITLAAGVYKIETKCAARYSIYIDGVQDVTTGVEAGKTGSHIIKLTKSSIVTLKESTGSLAIQSATIQSKLIITRIHALEGEVTSVSSGTATTALDGSSINMTFTIPAGGTTEGLVTTPIITSSYPFFTGATNISTAYFDAATGNITFTATISLADDPTLFPPNTAAINYDVVIGSLNTTASGIVNTDPMYSILTGANLAAYISAPDATMVGIELTFDEMTAAYATLNTYGNTAFDYAVAKGVVPNSYQGLNSRTVANSSVATQVPNGVMLYVFGTCSNMTYNGTTNTLEFKIYDAALTSGMSTGVIPATTPIYTTNTGTANGVHFFTYKGGYLTTQISQIAVGGFVNQITGQATGNGAAMSTAGNVITALTTANPAAETINIQGLGL